MRLDDIILLGALGLATAAAVRRLGGLRATFAAMMDAEHEPVPTARRDRSAPGISPGLTGEDREA
jgi:hypothetical protein